MLFLLPLVAAAIVVLGHFMGADGLPGVMVGGLLNLQCLDDMNPLGRVLTGIGGMLVVAYLIFIVNNVFRLLYQRTTLPALIYVLLTAGMVMSLHSCNFMVAILLMVLAFVRLLMAVNEARSNAPLFDFGLLMTLAVVFYPKLVVMLLWTMCVPMFSGRSTLRDFSALLTGMMTTGLFVVFGAFWTDQLAILPQVFTENLLSGEFVDQLPHVEVVRLGMLLPLLLIALWELFARYPAMTVSQRRGLLALVSMMLFMVINLLAVPGNYVDYMYMLAFPLSFIYAFYFISQRLVWIGNVMFFLLLGACFLNCFI